MDFHFHVLDWTALAPGMTSKSTWESWGEASTPVINTALPVPKCAKIPMMMARRLNTGSRLAVDCSLQLQQRHPDIDAIVFSSRHGELERNYRILSDLAHNEQISPTHFALSVHNSAVGSLAIMTQSPVPTSSISAGRESFQQGLYEVLSLLHCGYQRVLYVDFEGHIPEVYHHKIPTETPYYPYACAFLLTKGSQWHCTPEIQGHTENDTLPQSLQFLRGIIKTPRSFVVTGDTHIWRWQSELSQ